MNPKKGGGKASYAATSSSSPKGKSVTPQFGHSSGGSGFGNSPKADHLVCDVAGLSIDTPLDDGWAVFSKKNKNRGGTSAAPKQWGSSTGRGNTRLPGGAWQSQPADFHGSTAGRGTKMVPSSDRGGLETSYRAPPPVVAPPLKEGWQWNSRPNASANIHANRQDFGSDDADGSDHQGDVDVDDEDDVSMEDTDDDLLSDDFDSDDSAKSHGTRKQHKWFKDFFEVLDRLKVEEINEPSRQWHCPACKNGPGAIDWYRGLQPLMAHAKTKGAKRVKVHRELAEILDEELIRRGTSVIPSGELFGKWKGLRETVCDREIVWPPMVMVRNTLLDKDDNEKWIGMGNQELLEYFSGYNAVKARHSYGPQGHRGISLLIFENSAIGYVEAERLHKHFAKQGTDRDAWDHRKVLFLPGGTRQLYGYMANKEDLDIFNQHCQGKMKLKFEMRSHHEMVVIPMKQMDEDNQQLVYLKNKVVKEKKNAKALQESYGKVAEKLRETLEENRIVRQRTKMQHEQNKEEMDYQEQFFKDQINHIHQASEEKERAFEELLQEERKKMQQSIVDSSANEELRQEKISRFIQTQDKGIEEFEAEREKLIQILEGEKAEIKRKYLEEEVEVEKKFDTALTELMKKYSPQPITEQD